MPNRDPAGNGFPLATIWLGALLALFAVVFVEIGSFLLRIEGSSHAYGPDVFTGFQLKFWDTDDLMGAAGPRGVWDTNELARPFVSWHLTLDLVFPFLLGLALFRALVAVTEPRPRSRRQLPRQAAVVVLPLLYVGLDLAETGYTFDAMRCRLRGLGCEFRIDSHQAMVIHLLSDLKWIALVATLLVIAAFYFWSGSAGAASWQRRQERRSRLRASRQLVPGPPVGAVVVVGLLLVLLALPGGSALDQMPDVIRAQVDEVQDGDYGHATYSLLFLLLFVATLFVIVHPPTDPVVSYERPSCEAVGSRWQRLRIRNGLCRRDALVVGGGVLISAVLVVAHRLVEDAWDLPVGLAPGIVVLAVFLLAVSTTEFRRYVEDRHRELRTEPEPDAELDAEAVRVAERSAAVRAALLPGVVLVGAGVALVRAELPPVLKAGKAQPGEVVALLVGLALAGVLSVVLAAALDRLQRSRRMTRQLRWFLALPLGVLVMALAAALAVAPERAARLGAVAVVLAALSAWLVIVAVFALASRHVVWQRTVDLKLGPRTPWLALTIVVWLVAGVLDSTGGYHDTRTVDADDAAASSDRTLDDAFNTWAAQFGSPETAPCDDVIVDPSGNRPASAVNDTRKVPLVLVAAPGGGGKAAYWTALGMDRTFTAGGFCPPSLFAASGVSGGSVGLTAALAMAPAADEVEDDPQASRPEDDPRDDAADERDGAGDVRTPEDAEDVVRRMTDEGPLAETIAALLLRDMPQPFTTLRRQWRDRAAVLEDAWAEAAPSEVFDDDATTLDDLGRDWWTAPAESGPVLLLNASSVNDGCRVLVANVRGVSSGGRGCLSAPITAIDAAPSGAVSGSLDALDQLLPGRAEGAYVSDETTEEEYCVDHEGDAEPAAQTLRATTSALLSARFPYVTPAGAMRRCLDVDERNLNEESALVVRRPRRSSPPGSPAGQLGQTPLTADTGDAEEEQRRLLSDTAYVVDGGYLENTGILSLLQVWEQVEPRVVACNAAASADSESEPPPGASPGPFVVPDGCPQDARGHLWVEPWFVMLENHYRSRVVPALSSSRPAEVLVPLATASRKGATLGTTPLEQAMAIAVSRSYRSLPTSAPAVVSSCNRFVRLAPLKSPVVEAPLGWVLADDTRGGMRQAMSAAWAHNLTVYGGTAHSSLQQRCTSYLDRVRVNGPVRTGDDHRR